MGAILAAGFGTRMQPFTDVVPKPLLPFLNTPIIAYCLDHLYRAGARRIGINLHHLGEAIPPVLERIAAVYPDPIELIWVEESEARGTAGGIAGIWAGLGRPEATLISVNGDSVMDVDLAAELRHHRTAGAAATMLTRPARGGHPGGVAADAHGEVVRLRDLRVADGGRELDFMGVHLLEPATLRCVDEAAQADGTPCMVGDVYMPAMRRDERPRTSVVDAFWVALDTPQLLLDATGKCLTEPMVFPQSPAPSPVTVVRPSHVSGNALIAPPVFLGAFAQVGHGARIGPGVCIDGTAVGKGATVSDAILYGMERVEGTWSGCVAIAGKVAQVRSTLPSSE